MNQPQVSIIMSIYNGEAYVSQAIESILNQTLTELELIIIDDGSTDDTWEIISKYARQDSRVVPIRNEQNVGTSGALNKGLALARGTYITRQDGDDCSLPERLAAQIAFLEKNPDIGVVGTAVQMINEQGGLLSIWSGPTTDAEIQTTLLDHMCFCGPTVLIRRQHLQSIGFYFDERLSYSEDYDLCLRLAEVTKMAGLAEPLYQYRQHANSVSYSRRYKQMHRKAMALEQAIYRRFGPAPTVDKFANVARDYLRAAILGYANDEIAGARVCLDRALTLKPALLRNGDLLEEILRRYLRDRSVEEALDFTEAIFDDLFSSQSHLSRVKARLLSKLHMNEVFVGLDQNQIGRIDQHLWSGIRQDPTWLLNRGVLALLVKTFFLNWTRLKMSFHLSL